VYGVRLFCNPPGPVFGAVTPTPLPEAPVRAPGLTPEPDVPLRDVPPLFDDAANAGVAPNTVKTASVVNSFFI
jgi:hypothetical protein